MPIGGLVTGQRVDRYLRYYQACETWPAEKIAAEQGRLLRGTLRTAYDEIPFYRDLFVQAGIRPEDIREAADLVALPITTKDMLRDAFPDRCTRMTKGPLQMQSTSGSTGRPFRSVIDADTQARARALMFLRAMISGYRPGDDVLQTGSSPSRGKLKALKDRLLGTRYVSTYDMTDTVLDRCLDTIAKDRIQYLMGTAQTMYLIARHASAVGFQHPLQGVVSWGSLLLPIHRQQIHEAFSCRVFDTYGVSEGMQIAAQCGEAHGEYHQFPLHVIAEMSHEGAPATTGKSGDVLLTRLNAGAMPFIRYRVGDRAVVSDNAPCPCGRTTPRLASIQGRTSDIVTTPNGNRLTVNFFSSLFGAVSGLVSFQVRQIDLEHLHITVAVDESGDLPDLNLILEQILHKGDSDLQITIEVVNEIPLEKSGKQKYIVSDVELQ